MEYNLRCIFCDLTHKGTNLSAGNPRVALLPFRCGILNHLLKIIHAGHVSGYKLLIISFLLQYLMNDSKIERIVAVRAHLPIPCCLAGGDAGTRIDVGAFHTLCQRSHKNFGLLYHKRFDDVTAIKRQVFGIFEVET